MVSLLQLAAEKKTPYFGAARKSFGPSYFVTALVSKKIKIQDGHGYWLGFNGCHAFVDLK